MIKKHNGPFLFGLGLTDAKYFWLERLRVHCQLGSEAQAAGCQPLKDRQGEITSSQLMCMFNCVCVFVHRPSMIMKMIFFGCLKVDE